jgi:hypothetical protein
MQATCEKSEEVVSAIKDDRREVIEDERPSTIVRGKLEEATAARDSVGTRYRTSASSINASYGVSPH